MLQNCVIDNGRWPSGVWLVVGDWWLVARASWSEASVVGDCGLGSLPLRGIDTQLSSTNQSSPHLVFSKLVKNSAIH
jgi:hypothetical protein